MPATEGQRRENIGCRGRKMSYRKEENVFADATAAPGESLEADA